MEGWEPRLAVAILAQAVSDALSDDPKSWPQDETDRIHHQNSAQRYFSRSSTSLTDLCFVAHIDPDYLLQGMRMLSHAPPVVRAKAKAALAALFYGSDQTQGSTVRGDDEDVDEVEGT